MSSKIKRGRCTQRNMSCPWVMSCLIRTACHVLLFVPRMGIETYCKGGKKLRVINVDVHEMSMDYVMFEVELGHGRPLLCPSVFTL